MNELKECYYKTEGGYKLISSYCIVLDWEDINGNSHQDHFVSPSYDNTGRDWIHTWENPEEGLKRFLSHCPLHKITVRTFDKNTYRALRSMFIVIPLSIEGGSKHE